MGKISVVYPMLGILSLAYVVSEIIRYPLGKTDILSSLSVAVRNTILWNRKHQQSDKYLMYIHTYTKYRIHRFILVSLLCYHVRTRDTCEYNQYTVRKAKSILGD